MGLLSSSSLPLSSSSLLPGKTLLFRASPGTRTRMDRLTLCLPTSSLPCLLSSLPSSSHSSSSKPLSSPSSSSSSNSSSPGSQPLLLPALLASSSSSSLSSLLLLSRPASSHNSNLLPRSQRSQPKFIYAK